MENENLYNFEDTSTNISELDEIISADDILSGLEEDNAVLDSDDFIKKDNEVEVLSEEVVSSSEPEQSTINDAVEEKQEAINENTAPAQDTAKTENNETKEETILIADDSQNNEEEILVESVNEDTPQIEATEEQNTDILDGKIVVDEETENLVKSKIQQHQDLLGNKLTTEPVNETETINTEEEITATDDTPQEENIIESSEEISADEIIDDIADMSEIETAEEIVDTEEPLKELTPEDIKEPASEPEENITGMENTSEIIEEEIKAEDIISDTNIDNEPLEVDEIAADSIDIDSTPQPAESIENEPPKETIDTQQESDEIDITIEDEENKSFFDEELEDESISLSKDELSNILEDNNVEMEEPSEASAEPEVPTVENIMSEENNDIPLEQVETTEIDENDILNNEVEFEEIETLEEDKQVEIKDIDSKSEDELKEQKVLEETSDIDELENSKDSEVLSEEINNITPENLEPQENIVEENEEVIDNSKISESSEQTEESAGGSSFFDEDEDESISLTGNELDNILQTTEVVEEVAEVPNENIETEIETQPAVSDTIQEDEKQDIVENKVLENVDSLKSEIANTAETDDEIDMLEKDEELSSDVKKILKYLDELLEKLPEEEIKKFAESKYYDLYVSLLDKLGI